MIIIDRETGSNAFKQMLNQGRAALAEGRSLLVFPQGSRMRPGDPIRFRRGIELLYGQLDTPVLPMVVNSGDFWEPAHAFKKPGTITVSYLKTVPPGLVSTAVVHNVQSLWTLNVANLMHRNIPRRRVGFRNSAYCRAMQEASNVNEVIAIAFAILTRSAARHDVCLRFVAAVSHDSGSQF
nr:lysophospholipid acyltransferase family protein [Salinihabitans flavidus]